MATMPKKIREKRTEHWETWATELPVSIGYQLQKLAIREGVSRSKLLRRIITDFVIAQPAGR